MHVLKWRHSQEKQNALINKKKKFMSKAELKYFIEHYEKLTRFIISIFFASFSIIIYFSFNLLKSTSMPPF